MTLVWTTQNGQLVRRVGNSAWTPSTLWNQASLQQRPTGSQYVRYEDIYQSGDTFQQTCNRVTADTQGNPRILTLPEGIFYISDFINGYYDGVRIGNGGASNCRGIVGSGRGTIIKLVQDTATRMKPDTDNKGNPGYLAGNIICTNGRNNVILSNFQLQGTSQIMTDGTQLYYNGILVSNCPGAQVSWLYLKGGSQGYANSPPGETFGISAYMSNDVTISDTEIDGRDATTNARVSASPIGWNGSKGASRTVADFTFVNNAAVYRTYCHHGRTGMPTFWITNNVYSEDLWSFSTGSGTSSQGGAGINHEEVKGTVYHKRPYCFVHGVRSTGEPPAPLPSLADTPFTTNDKHNMTLLTTVEDVGANTTIEEPVWDQAYAGSGLFVFTISDAYKGGLSDGSTSAVVTPPKIIKNGVTLQVKNHPASGWNTADPAAYYAWVH